MSAPASLQLGPITVHTPLLLAPMAGVTDPVFRRLCREQGEAALVGVADPLLARSGPQDAPSGLYVAEMVTARALLEGDPGAWKMVTPDQEERVRSVQLYGTDAVTLGEAAKTLVERGLADHIDLNFGCPVPKVTRKGGGAAIPWKRDLFHDIVTSVVSNVDQGAPGGPGSVPVTVKMRIGIDDDHVTVTDAGNIAQSAGVAGVGLHARTQEQYYSGQAQWEWIARLKDQLTVPVFGNGDVFAGPDAQRMLQETGCDAVIVGRGAQGRPWMFSAFVAALWGLPDLPLPSLGEVIDILMVHANSSVLFHGDELRAIREMRKHVLWYLKGFPVGGAVRSGLSRVSTVEELEQLLSNLDRDLQLDPQAFGRGVRKGNPRKPHLPHGWLDSQFLQENERGGLFEAEDGVSGG